MQPSISLRSGNQSNRIPLWLRVVPRSAVRFKFNHILTEKCRSVKFIPNKNYIDITRSVRERVAKYL